MSKMLILEVRPSRQRLFLPNREKDIETLLSISGLSAYSGDIVPVIPVI